MPTPHSVLTGGSNGVAGASQAKYSRGRGLRCRAYPQRISLHGRERPAHPDGGARRLSMSCRTWSRKLWLSRVDLVHGPLSASVSLNRWIFRRASKFSSARPSTRAGAPLDARLETGKRRPAETALLVGRAARIRQEGFRPTIRPPQLAHSSRARIAACNCDNSCASYRLRRSSESAAIDRTKFGQSFPLPIF